VFTWEAHRIAVICDAGTSKAVSRVLHGSVRRLRRGGDREPVRCLKAGALETGQRRLIDREGSRHRRASSQDPSAQVPPA